MSNIHLNSNIDVKYIFKIYIIAIKYINNCCNIVGLITLDRDALIPPPPKLGTSVPPVLKPRELIPPPLNLGASIPLKEK